MSTDAGSTQELGRWSKSDRAAAVTLTRPAARAASGNIHVVIVSSVFMVLFAATLLVGGHAAIDPLLDSATKEPRDPRSAADVVYTMPDGVFCRHVSYDNVTGEQTGESLERCEKDIAREAARPGRHFTWKTN
jgi:hypothetical protein